MKSSTVFAIAAAFGLTFVSAITAAAHFGWSITGDQAVERNVAVKQVDATRTSAVAD